VVENALAREFVTFRSNTHATQDEKEALMRIDVVGRNVEVTDAIRQYADNKAEKLTKYYDGLQAVLITISRANAHHTTDYTVELILDVVKHKDFVSHATAKDPYAGIDVVCEKGERHLREFKSRLRDNKH
jgi:putative sigma-54 modulation protein